MTAAFFPALVVVALFGVRVIGARVGWLRAILISWLGLASAGFLLFGIGRAESSPPVSIAVVIVGLVAMVAWTAVFDLIAPSRRSPNRRAELNPATALRRAISRTGRRAALAVLAARFGLGRYARRHAPGPSGAATGAALRETLQRAGGVYVKLGQFLSTRPDLVSADIADELRSLQQSVGPVPFDAVCAVLAEDFADRGDPDELFAELHAEPAAAASIAQVHRGVTPDGQAVAVKVQRPEIAERIRRDLDILVRTTERLETRTRWAADLGLAVTARAFAHSVEGELDFTAEARNLRLLATAVEAHRRVVVPQPVDHLTRRRVLVMEWVDGEPITAAARHLEPADRTDLAGTLLCCTLDQILTAGTFHADPHPGNILLTSDGRVALIDCGAVGALDRRQRHALRTTLAAVASQDPAQLAVAVRRITTPSRSIDQARLERALGGLLVEHLRPGATPGVELVASLMGQMRVFGLAIDPAIAGALRALATLQSTLQTLDPAFDLVREATTHARHATLNPLRQAGADDSPRAQLEALLPEVLPTVATLPRRLDRIVETLERDELSVGVHLFPTDDDRRVAGRVASQLTIAVVPAALGVIGALLVLAANPQLGTGTGRVIQAVGLSCVGVALLVLFSTLVNALRSLRER
ncbi:MAG: hypothetical protein GEV08_03845 [Acidimicrobiia bacterium]|nr:hypothetical protein [Acidimicrobiia bacterium]